MDNINNHGDDCARLALTCVAALIVSATLIGCQSNSERMRQSNWPEGELKEEWSENLSDEERWVKNGPFTAFYQNGQVQESGFFSLGKKSGVWTSWYDNGSHTRLMRGSFVDGEMDGYWEYWMDPAHHGTSSHAHSDSAEDSLHTENAENSHPKPHKRESYTLGKADGLWLSWHSETQVADSSYFVNGQLEGTVISYYDNGVKSSEAHYANGTLVGQVVMWDRSGKILVKELQGRP